MLFLAKRLLKRKKQVEEEIKAKYVPKKVEDSVELGKSAEININFLGSGWLAKNHKDGGNRTYEPYNKFEHVYYYCCKQADKLQLYLVFSGPTMLDIVKPTVKSLTKDAKKVLSDLLLFIRHKIGNDGKIEINITGHSRGGVIAQSIHTWLKRECSLLSINLGALVQADPYAGPFNRRIHRKMANFDKNFDDDSIDKKPLPGHITVYTANEWRFRTPAKKISRSETIVFTNAEHDYSKYVAYLAAKDLKGKHGVYICVVNNESLNKLQNNDGKDSEEILRALKEDDKVEPILIDSSNIKDILLGNGNYRNFSFKNLASEGRRKLFYKTLANIDESCRASVIMYLKGNGHKSMAEEIFERQKKIYGRTNREEEKQERKQREDGEKEKKIAELDKNIKELEARIEELKKEKNTIEASQNQNK